MTTDIERSTTSAITNTDVESEAKTDAKTDASEKVTSEEFKITGDVLVSKVKELIHEGNVRRIIIKNDEDRTLIEMPLNVGVIGGVIGAALAPVIVALGALGAMVAHLTLIIERSETA